MPKGGGKGWGYQGTCFRCGVIGHKAAECNTTRQQIGEIAWADSQPQPPTEYRQPAPAKTADVSSVGGVWSISEVSKEDGGDEVSQTASLSGLEEWTVVKGRWRKEPRVLETKGDFQVSAGRFAMLCPVDVECGEAHICSMTTEITVDSAAEESVCPLHWAEQFRLNPVEAGQELRLVNASGGRINHWGSRRVAMHSEETGKTLEMGFQVTDAKKPLLSVSRLCENGNLVQFGPRPGDSFAQSVATGEKLQLEKRGNSWVIPGELAQNAGF